ncbi:XRE family transcriptional regulator [bacterium]|nr:MAG: XRE family transcriptional regulator [bacterium]
MTPSSGNVFADLGFEHPEEEQTKSRLVSAIADALAASGLNQSGAAALIGLDQPKVSRLLRGQTTGYSIERLNEILNRLDRDVEIIVRPKPEGRPARTTVLVV